MGSPLGHFFQRGTLIPSPIPVPVRQLIIQRAAQGQSSGLIARSLGLVTRTVRRLVQRFGFTLAVPRPRDAARRAQRQADA